MNEVDFLNDGFFVFLIKVLEWGLYGKLCIYIIFFLVVSYLLFIWLKILRNKMFFIIKGNILN